jgi:hypothetical protein
MYIMYVDESGDPGLSEDNVKTFSHFQDVRLLLD